MGEEINYFRTFGGLEEKDFMYTGLFIWFPAGQGWHCSFILHNYRTGINSQLDSK